MVSKPGLPGQEVTLSFLRLYCVLMLPHPVPRSLSQGSAATCQTGASTLGSPCILASLPLLPGAVTVAGVGLLWVSGPSAPLSVPVSSWGPVSPSEETRILRLWEAECPCSACSAGGQVKTPGWASAAPAPSPRLSVPLQVAQNRSQCPQEKRHPDP